MTIQDQLVSQLEQVLAEFDALLKRSKHDDISDLPEAEVTRFVSRAEAAIQRVAGRPSPYVDQSDRVFKQGGYTGYMARSFAGILQGLRSDVAAGYLRSQRELIHAELFADFLEMSQHLLNEGYKDAAAVIAGSSLEAHLRQLCERAVSPATFRVEDRQHRRKPTGSTPIWGPTTPIRSSIRRTSQLGSTSVTRPRTGGIPSTSRRRSVS